MISKTQQLIHRHHNTDTRPRERKIRPQNVDSIKFSKSTNMKMISIRFAYEQKY